VNFSVRLPEPVPASFFVRSAFYPWLIVSCACFGGFMGQLDASIVQLAMPSLETAFDAPINAVSWVAVGYMLAVACALPIFARLAEIAGRKSFFLSGFASFAILSTLCGFAPTLGSMVGLRVLLGIGAAMTGANSVVILVTAVGPERRGKALGIMAATQAVGFAMGPTVGGLLLGTLGWRWVFWVNVPLSLLAFVLSWLIVPKTATFGGDSRFDWLGAAFLVPALATLLVVIAQFHAWGPSPALVACLVAAPILLAAFIWSEGRTTAPLLDLRLFRSRSFSAGTIGVLLSYAMLFGMFFAMSYAFVRGYREQPVAAGLRLTIIPVALGVVAPFAGSVSERYSRLVLVAGPVLCGLSALTLTQTLSGAQGSLPIVMIGLAVYGVGLGLYIASNNNETMAAAPIEKSATAGGLINLLRIFGAGAGVAASATVLAWRLDPGVGAQIRTSQTQPLTLIAAVDAILVLLAIFAAIGTATALIRDRPKAFSVETRV
jgi:EmrB/QacA subfamily drug resistance transporter